MTDLSVVVEIAKLAPAGLMVLLIAMILRADVYPKHSVLQEREARERERQAEQQRYDEMCAAKDKHFNQMVQAKDSQIAELKDYFSARLLSQQEEMERWREAAVTGALTTQQALTLAGQRET